MAPKLSVIIPTHDRIETLKRCLQHLEKQTIASELEVIVINDVQDSAFDALAKESNWQMHVHFETIAPCQQGVARNYGVTLASSPTVLFIGDDIFLKEDASTLHESIHRHRSGVAVLGSTMWDPQIEITPAMEWLMRSGWQFGYPKIDQYAGDVLPTRIQHQFAYTSHISIARETALKTLFREDVSLYGWEDVEWGIRLRDAGIQIYYEPNAKGFHHHSMTLEDSLRRMETVGESAVLIKQIAPDFDRLPHGWKKVAYHIFAKFPTMAGRHRAAFLRGIERGKKQILEKKEVHNS